MIIETWYYLKETNDVLEDMLIHEVLMYKVDGRFVKLVVEESGKGFQEISDFPYRIYRKRSEALSKFRKIKYVFPNYKVKRLGDCGFEEQTIRLDKHVERISAVFMDEEDE
jgi:hypothetical protein